jgi:Annelid erythrocruorin linker subunit C-terminus
MLLQLICAAGPAKSGNVFTGTAEWVSCQSRHDHPVKVTITGVARANFFGARLIVRGKVAADFVDDPDHVRITRRSNVNYLRNNTLMQV